GAAAPCAQDYRQRFLEALAAFVARDTEALEVDRDGAAPDAVFQPSAGQDIGGGGLLGRAQRMMKRKQRDRGAEPDAAGALGGGHRHHQRRRHDRKAFEEVQLGEPGNVEAELVGQRYLFEGLAVARRLRLVGSTRQLVEKAELHDSSPSAPARNPGAPRGSELHCTPARARQPARRARAPAAARDARGRAGCYPRLGWPAWI